MLPRIPFLFSDNETLTPLKLSSNFKRIKTDIRNLLRRRYFYSSFLINFNTLASGVTQGERSIKINPPKGLEVIGVEVCYYSTAATTVTISSSNAGFESFTVTGVGATQRAYKYKNQSVVVAANSDFDIICNQSSGTADGLKIIVHLRVDRFSESEPDEFTFTEFKSGDSALASKLNTLFSTIKTIVDDSDANVDDLRIQVINRIKIPVSLPTVDNKHIIPDSGKSLSKITLGVFGPVGNSLTGTLTNKTGSTIVAQTVACDGALKLGSTTTSGVQPDNTPEASTSDWKLTLTRTGTDIIANGYVVLYWE